MKTLYIECKMGVAGDMLSAALLELCDNRDEMLGKLAGLGIPGVTFSLDKTEKCGIMGSHLTVKVNGEEEISEDVEHHHHEEAPHSHGSPEHHHHDHKEVPFSQGSTEHVHTSLEETSASVHSHHSHRHLSDIEHIVSSLNTTAEVKKDIMNVYKLIAEAESTVHGTTVSEVHFHEVGSMDAVADISATCLIMNGLAPGKIIASPINVGSGQVKCAHGILPVPTPATALLLKGIPFYSSDVKGELCTPTGAALIKYFAKEFGAQPAMNIDAIGYGMGKKDFPQANCVRTFYGTGINSDADKTGTASDSDLTDTISELVCNLDDMTPEAIGFATERLMEEGALDVFTTSIGMKKNRPGTMLTVLCRENEKDSFVRKIFKYTTTIGVRENICKRYILKREEDTITTPDGDIRVKKVSGYGVSREKQEYEDRAKIARKNDTAL
ncbi:nickel pincer cofactor biosynthesis protein LarC [Butyrivibrio sp. FC2001]|uniref:nickel pincer cofactor biosynthesis protein LarC n=1 Tax=Butyrivibrio sp. FC2001 TaxID=1280671 RepID=UPI0004168FFD|nr:nickel pincer cofactor biosynthesis protein LarC [Butyrivibrio sp. FC2001]